MRQYVEWDHSEGLSAIASRTLNHVMSLQIEQRGKQPQLNQTPSTPHQFYVTFRSSIICSVTILLHTPAQAKSTNIARLRLTYSKYKMRWCIDHSTPFRTSPIIKDSSLSDWPRNWSHVSICKQAEHWLIKCPPGIAI